MRIAVIILFAAILALGCPSGQAQSSLTSGDYTIYYGAMPTSELSPDVARNYAITRSANRALLNIAVRRREVDGDVAVTAGITGSISNDAGQRQALAVREIREGEAIYYLGEPRMRPGDRLVFDLEVTPAGSERPIAVRFSRQFFQ